MKKTILLLLSISCVLALLACDKREDFPPTFEVTVPPTPTDFTATWVQARGEYDLTWNISGPDSVLVSRYFVYLSSGLQPPDTIGTTINRSFSVSFPFEAAGLIFGVTSVSDQNVESDFATFVTQ